MSSPPERRPRVFFGEREDRYSEILGRSRFRTVKKLVTELLQVVDPMGTLGRE